MPDPLLLPSIALLAGGALTVDYMRRRFASAEDRYMALYGQDDWAASNMDLVLHFPSEADEHVKRTFAERLANLLEAEGDGFRVIREVGDFAGDRLLFRKEPALDVDALFRPRRGVYFETELPGRIRVVWNHMQTDGVG